MPSQEYHKWWYDRFPGAPLNSKDAKTLSLISVKGNRFVNSNGDTVLFRGLSISDPDKIANQGHWSKEHFEKIKELGTMLIRIPVHPVSWRERTPEKYLVLLDQAVESCTELGMYIIIDWHSIGNLKEELFSGILCTILHSKKLFNSGERSQGISSEIIQSLFMNCLINRHCTAVNLETAHGVIGKR